MFDRDNDRMPIQITDQLIDDVYNDNNDCIILRPTELEPKKGFYINIEK